MLLVDGYKLELVAREPDIVTLIGMAFDPRSAVVVAIPPAAGRLQGPGGIACSPTRMATVLDRTTFGEGYWQVMNIASGPTGPYLVTRRDVRLLEDTDGDGRPTRRQCS